MAEGELERRQGETERREGEIDREAEKVVEKGAERAGR